MGPSGVKVVSLTDGSLIRTFALGNYGAGADLPKLSDDGGTAMFERDNWTNCLGIMARVSGGSEYSFGTCGAYGLSPSMALSPDGSTVAAIIVGADTNINLYRVSDKSLTRTLTGHAASVRALAFSPDSTTTFFVL